MDYEFFDKVEFLENKIAKFEQSHYEKLLELKGFTTAQEQPINIARDKVEQLIDNFAEGIQVLKQELKDFISKDEV